MVSNEEMAQHFIATAENLPSFRFGIKYHPRLTKAFRSSEKYFSLIGVELKKHLRLLDPQKPIDLTEEELVFALNDPRSLETVNDPAGCENLRDLAGLEIVSHASSSVDLLLQVAELCGSMVEQRAIKRARTLDPDNVELVRRTLPV